MFYFQVSTRNIHRTLIYSTINYLIYSTALLRAGSTYADKVFYKQFALQFLPYQSSLQTICFAILYLSAETPHEDDVLAQADLTLSVKVCTL